MNQFLAINNHESSDANAMPTYKNNNIRDNTHQPNWQLLQLPMTRFILYKVWPVNE